MPASLNHSAEQKSYWSLRLLTLLQEMAAQKTNAVLTVLANVEHLQVERHYPESGLLFAGKRWRAYYHCHETTSMHSNEHGHFHLFTDIGTQAWTHVAGLSIDAEGQPLQWLTVNRWVTDGLWLDSAVFLNQLKYVAANDEEGLVESWLSVLLMLYGDSLFELLKKRDQHIQRISKGRSREETLDDRELYTLATQSIDLQSMLEKNLLQANTNIMAATMDEKNVQQGT